MKTKAKPAKVKVSLPHVKKMHLGSLEIITEQRNWRSQFTQLERTEIEGFLKKRCSNELITSIELAAAEYFSFASAARQPTLKDERDKAQVLSEISLSAFRLLVPKEEYSTTISPIDSLQKTLDTKIPKQTQKIFIDLLILFHKTSLDYVLKHSQIPSNRRDDGKWYFVSRVKMAFEQAGIKPRKGTGTVFYNVLQVAFQLLGKDAVKEPARYCQ